MSNQLDRLDSQSFSVIAESEAREVLGGLAQLEAAAKGYSFCNPTSTTTTGGTSTDKDIDDTFE